VKRICNFEGICERVILQLTEVGSERVNCICNFEGICGRVILQLTEVGSERVNCINLAQIKDHWGAVVEKVLSIRYKNLHKAQYVYWGYSVQKVTASPIYRTVEKSVRRIVLCVFFLRHSTFQHFSQVLQVESNLYHRA
jgi:hypothetical protein